MLLLKFAPMGFSPPVHPVFHRTRQTGGINPIGANLRKSIAYAGAVRRLNSDELDAQAGILDIS